MKRNLSPNFNLLVLLLILFSINLLASVFHSRIDLTKEKRYTLSKATKDLFGNLDGQVTIDVFFKGNYPRGLKRSSTVCRNFYRKPGNMRMEI